MTKLALSVSFRVFLLLLFAPPAFAQKPHQPAKPAFPEYHKYSNWKSRIKVDPYKQDTLMHPIPFARAIFHDRIDKEQLIADKADGLEDTLINYKGDSASSVGLTQALLYDVDTMQILIENMPAKGRDSFAENQQKIRYLRAVWELLRTYNNDPKPDPQFYIALEDNMDSMLIAINEHKLMAFVVANPDKYTLNNSKILFENPSPERTYIYVHMGKTDPLMMIKRLPEYAADTFAGDVIAAAARMAPSLIFDYATSTNIPIKAAVYRTNDSLVQAIVKIAAFSKSPPRSFRS